MCDLPSLRDEVYDLFRQHPELLVPCEEGLTKGKLTSYGFAVLLDSAWFCARPFVPWLTLVV